MVSCLFWVMVTESRSVLGSKIIVNQTPEKEKKKRLNRTMNERFKWLSVSFFLRPDVVRLTNAVIWFECIKSVLWYCDPSIDGRFKNRHWLPAQAENFRIMLKIVDLLHRHFTNSRIVRYWLFILNHPLGFFFFFLVWVILPSMNVETTLPSQKEARIL